MTKFEQRLQLNKELSAKTYKEAVWCLLIAYGGALKNQEADSHRYQNGRFGSYYSSQVECDLALTKSILELIKKHGIDFEACSDPAQHRESRFNGTFTSSSLTVHVLWGRLVLGNGSSVLWGLQLENPGFGNLVRLLTSDNKPIDNAVNDAVDHLQHRLDNRTSYPGMNSFYPELQC